jgi:ubiquinone/menaquinone biosynthesis C-methylase UbiE
MRGKSDMIDAVPHVTDEQGMSDQAFVNPFRIADVAIFDVATMRELLAHELSDWSVVDLAIAAHDAPDDVARLLQGALPASERDRFKAKVRQPAFAWEIRARQQRLVDALFWELTYWITPEWYDELTEGEQLHPGIFRQLRPWLRDHVVLDAGAGTGRASLDALRQGARRVIAVDPAPGLLRILATKAEARHLRDRMQVIQGHFDALPLSADSVDLTLSCASFTVENDTKATANLKELRRVTKSGGRIVFIWPRPQDVRWLERQGFRHIKLEMQGEMHIRYRSLAIALRIADRFYGRNRAVKQYLIDHRQPVVPFWLLGMHPPHDYCWTTVNKG